LRRRFYGFRVETKFSSLSESGFIPTKALLKGLKKAVNQVLISFREWLHSYSKEMLDLFMSGLAEVLISFREWLHSYGNEEAR